ncbi:MAG: MFS transporter [Promethearchaeota archaeon]
MKKKIMKSFKNEKNEKTENAVNNASNAVELRDKQSKLGNSENKNDGTSQSVATVSINHDEKVSLIEKISYSLGVIPSSLFGTFMGNIQAFYLAWMYLKQEWIVIAQICYGIWNLINDPIFGQLQDRTRTRRGRYIPWIKWTAPLLSIAFILVFYPLPQWRITSENMFELKQIYLFLWYLFTLMLYDTFFTIIYLAYTALLPQMTMNEAERVKISIMSGIAGSIGVALSWVPIAFLTDPNQEKINQLQLWVLIVGLLALIPWIFLVKYVKEHKEYIPPVQEKFIQNLKYVFKNPSGRIYILYDGISVGIMNFIMSGLTFALTWIFGLNSEYQEINPEWNISSLIPYFIPIGICLLVGLIVQLKIPQKYDIKTAIHVGLISEAIGLILAFVGCIPSAAATLDPNIPYIPQNLWLISLGMSIASFGFLSDPIYHNPMRADTIDYDEYLTGERREAVYAGLGCIFSKPMISVALASVTGIITAYGLKAKPDWMTDISTSLYWFEGYPNAILGVATAVFLVPGLLALAGTIIWHFYPLDRKRVAEVRKYLEELHRKKRAERLPSK